MIHIEMERRIDSPIGTVFERLVDVSAYSEWMSRKGLFISTTQDSEGPVNLGTRFSDKTRLGPLHGEIGEFDRPRKVVFHFTMRFLGKTVLEGWPAYTLSPEGDHATRVKHTVEARLARPLRVFEPVLRRVAAGERRRTVDSLQASLESSPAD